MNLFKQMALYVLCKRIKYSDLVVIIFVIMFTVQCSVSIAMDEDSRSQDQYPGTCGFHRSHKGGSMQR